MTAPPSKPKVPEVLELVRAYYRKPGNLAGGKLHVVLDDGNIADSMIRSCLQELDPQTDAEACVIAEKMLLMSRTQRRKIVRDGRGSWDE